MMDNTKKRVLLLAPPYMDIYKDILTCLEQMNYEVLWVKDGQINGNPYNKKNINRHTKSVDEYEKEVTHFWKKMFETPLFSMPFDYFFAIDGLMISHLFFEELNLTNPNIVKILYLYDRIEDNYELDSFFEYYDKIFTFDKSDSIKYRISHLPIYWVQSSEKYPIQYDVFGMASFNSIRRYKIFKEIRHLLLENGLKENIRLWHSHENRLCYFVKYAIRKIQGKEMLSPSQLDDDLFTEKVMTPDEFRRNIAVSRAILDTHTSYQDGLTARFMWALGCGKKIISTNESAKDYEFYNPEQVLIVKDHYEEIIDFVRKPYKVSEESRELILQYRIDNWIKTFFK